MNRFKFRVWDSSANAYVPRSQFILLPDGTLIQEIGGEEVIWESTQPEFCTGLRDKNGKLIYENDIFKIDDDIWCIFVDAYGLWTACYNGSPIRGCMEWGYFVKNYIIDRETPLLEVIGNINQNVDLLENEE